MPLVPAHAQRGPVVVIVESENRAVTARGVREAMADKGINVFGPADAPNDAVSLAIVFTAPERAVRFRLIDTHGRVHNRVASAPRSGHEAWIAERAARYLRGVEREPRATSSDVLDPWSRPNERAPREQIANPWSGETTGSVGAVAGTAVAHLSEVLDPWANRAPRSEVVDPWQRESAPALPVPRRR